MVCHQLLVWCIYWQTTDDHGICLCFFHQNGAIWLPEKLGKFGDFTVPFCSQAANLIKNSHFWISTRSFVTTKWGKKNKKKRRKSVGGKFQKIVAWQGIDGIFSWQKRACFHRFSILLWKRVYICVKFTTFRPKTTLFSSFSTPLELTTTARRAIILNL